jgi:hypothetical protein
MSNDADTLNALGLNLEGVGTEIGAKDVAAAADAVAAEKKKRQRVVIGDISAEEDLTDIPEVTRGNFGPRSTEPSALQKQFNETGAPYLNDAGKTAYRNFKVEFPGGDDEAWGAFYRSVQGVKNQTNKVNKEAGNAVYFIARSLEKDGKKYVLVIRTDARPVDEPAAE